MLLPYMALTSPICSLIALFTGANLAVNWSNRQAVTLEQLICQTGKPLNPRIDKGLIK